MPYNILLYPDDYAADVAEGATSSVEEAISQLALQSRDTAVKTAHNRRLAGQASIDNQNRLVPHDTSVMPLFEVIRKRPQTPPTPIIAQPPLPPAVNPPSVPSVPGVVNPPAGTAGAGIPPLLGTRAFFGGGRNLDQKQVSYFSRLTFSGEYISPINQALSVPRSHTGCCSHYDAGRVFGGWQGMGVPALDIDRLDYKTNRTRRLGSRLAEDRGIMAGVGHKTRGFLIGGVNRFRVISRSVLRHIYANEVISDLGVKLAQHRASPNQGVSSPANNSYVLGGYGYAAGAHAAFVWNGTPALMTIVRWAWQSETATNLANVLTHSHVLHAATGSQAAGYFYGGSPGVLPWVWFSNQITKLTYSGETHAVLGNTMTKARVDCFGAGSSRKGYVCGGNVSTSNWVGVRDIEGFTYASDTSAAMGIMLYTRQEGQSSLSDYSGGFSH